MKLCTVHVLTSTPTLASAGLSLSKGILANAPRTWNNTIVTASVEEREREKDSHYTVRPVYNGTL